MCWLPTDPPYFCPHERDRHTTRKSPFLPAESRMRLARRTEAGRGKGEAAASASCRSCPFCLPLGRGRNGGYISGRRKNGGRECFWLFLFTKEQRREREWMGGRTDGRMNDGESVYCGKPTERARASGARGKCHLPSPSPSLSHTARGDMIPVLDPESDFHLLGISS